MAVKKTATACALDSVGILYASAGLRPLVLISISDKVVNRFEEPSDIAGKIFEGFDDRWEGSVAPMLERSRLCFVATARPSLRGPAIIEVDTIQNRTPAQ